MALRLAGLDHIVLTVRDIEASCAFYERALGMEVVRMASGRTALHFAGHKINLHRAGAEFVPHAAHPAPGTGDFCLLTDLPMETVVAHLEERGVAIELGPVEREGARGPMISAYFRDPDGNLVELARYATG